jgi:hypothetical protein
VYCCDAAKKYIRIRLFKEIDFFSMALPSEV